MSAFKVVRKGFPDATVEADTFDQNEHSVSFYKGWRGLYSSPVRVASFAASTVTSVERIEEPKPEPGPFDGIERLLDEQVRVLVKISDSLRTPPRKRRWR